MVTILEFRPPEIDRAGQTGAPPSVKHPEGRSAEIIIFPGVRIERQSEPVTPSVAPKAKKRAKRTARRKS